MRKIPKKNQEGQSDLYEELRVYRLAGIQLWLEGLPSTPEEITKACYTMEGKSYMRDYIRNTKEEVTDIAFDLISEEG